MLSTRPLATLALLTLVGASASARAAAGDDACRPATVDAGVAEAPQPWREAVAQLVASTAVRGHPWSCRGGHVALTMRDDGATLHVQPAGEPAIARSLQLPADVVPLGQALLCLPSEAVAAAPVAAPSAVTPTLATVPSAAAVAVNERLLVSLHGGARLPMPRAGPSFGGDLRAAIPLGAWLPDVRLRWQHRGPRQDNLDDISMAVGLGHRWRWSRLELRAGVSVAAAVLIHDLPKPAGQDVRVDPRVGAALGVVVPLTSRLRLIGGIDGDLAPSRMPAGTSATTSGSTGGFPAATYGATLGFEVAL